MRKPRVTNCTADYGIHVRVSSRDFVLIFSDEKHVVRVAHSFKTIN
jgi:hypothetical protein